MDLIQHMETRVILLINMVQKLSQEIQKLEACKEQLELNIKGVEGALEEVRSNLDTVIERKVREKIEENMDTLKTEIKQEIDGELRELRMELRTLPPAAKVVGADHLKLPRYHEDDDPLLYITHLTILGEANHLSEEAMCRWFPTCLPLPAIPWYVSLDDVTKADFFSLKEQFIYRFSLSISERQVGREYDNLRAWDFPSLPKYIVKLEELGLKLNKRAADNVERFVNGLPEPHFRWTHKKSPTTLQEAVETVREFEALFAERITTIADHHAHRKQLRKRPRLLAKTPSMGSGRIPSPEQPRMHPDAYLCSSDKHSGDRFDE